jgi:undecaprenyl-diphosphatase
VVLFAVGTLVAFISAWFAVRFFVRLLSRWTMRPFGWYRIGAAAVLVLLIASSWVVTD